MAPNQGSRAGARLARRRGSRGFTLIELAIVAICISILAVMAVTSYEYATIKSRRANAQACLTEHSQYMERHYTTHMTYVGADEPGCSAEVSEHYEFTFSAEPTASAYTLQAKPLGRQEEAEQDCGTMTIDQVGRKTPAEHCW